MSIGIRSASIMICLCLGLMITAVAQQSPAKPRPVPTLTSEDLITIQPVAPRPAADLSKDKSALPSATGGSGPAKNKQSKETVSPEDKEKEAAEKAWSARLTAAQNKVRELERNADQAEIEITRLRNLQFSATAKEAETGGKINTQVAELAQRVRTLRDQVITAQSEVEALKSEGEAKEYKFTQGSSTLPDGRPDPTYYQSRSAELSQDLSDADSRIEVIQLRINDLNTRIRKNTGGLDGKGNATNGSDVFAIRRLKTALQEEQKKLAEVLDKKEASAKKLEDLRREAANAGVSEGSSQ